MDVVLIWVRCGSTDLKGRGGRYRHMWKNNTEVYVQEIWFEDVDWFCLAQDGLHWQAHLCLQVPLAGEVPTDCRLSADKPYSINKFNINDSVIYMALHVSTLWGQFQRLNSKMNFLYIS
jgi:hypothetical protein